MSVDMEQVLPDTMEAVMENSDPVAITATMQDWVTLRTAHESIMESDLQDGDFLRLVLGQKIMGLFVEQVRDHSTPRLDDDQPIPASQEVVVHIKANTFAAVMVSLAVVTREARDDVPEELQVAAELVTNAWAAFKPQMAALAPGFGTGL